MLLRELCASKLRCSAKSTFRARLFRSVFYISFFKERDSYFSSSPFLTKFPREYGSALCVFTALHALTLRARSFRETGYGRLKRKKKEKKKKCHYNVYREGINNLICEAKRRKGWRVTSRSHGYRFSTRYSLIVSIRNSINVHHLWQQY